MRGRVLCVEKQAAIAAGYDTYFTGKPCKRGHIAHRRVSGQCIECRQLLRKPERPRPNRYRRPHPGRANVPLLCECCVLPERGKKKLAWDHDHMTGQFRGWLCGGCNTSIGRLGDTIEGLMRAVRYLENASARQGNAG